VFANEFTSFLCRSLYSALLFVIFLQWCGPPLGGDSTVRFHRSFKCCYCQEERSYSLGDLCWIKSSREAAVCIVQIHTLWEKISNGRMFAGGRLFFRPEDTPKGRYPEHGQVR
jgi:hypothetical protein